MVVANAQTSCRLLTTLGKVSSWFNTHVWFVRPKLHSLSATGAVVLRRCSPIDTLWESRTECVGAGALHDVDERSRVEDYLGKSQFSTICQRSSIFRVERFRGFPTYHREIGEDWGSLSAAVDRPVIFFADGARRGIRREGRSGTVL